MRINNLTNRQLDNYFGHLEDHQYRHFNRSLGCFVEGKEHFKKLLLRGNFIPFELAEKYADEYDKKNPKKEYKISTKARDIINSVRLTADKHGNIKLGGRAIKALKEIGAIPSDPVAKQLEDIYKESNNNTYNIKGGFSKREETTFKVQRKDIK